MTKIAVVVSLHALELRLLITKNLKELK